MNKGTGTEQPDLNMQEVGRISTGENVQDNPLTEGDVSDAALALAQAQAAKDAELMEALKTRPKPEQEPFTITTTERVPMNRAQRRAQVKLYASLLAETERQVPVVNSTIIPKAQRRRRPGQHGRLQHA